MASLKFVAQQAGVSVGTVSNVLNRPWLVSPDKRDRVRAVIADSGYIPNPAARSLRAGTQRAVGVVVDDLRLSGRAEALRGVADRLEASGRQLLLQQAGGDPRRYLAQVQDLTAQAASAAVLFIDPRMMAAIDRRALVALLAALRKAAVTPIIIDTSRPASTAHLTTLSEYALSVTTTLAGCLDAALAVLLQLDHRDVDLVATPTAINDGVQEIKPVARAAGIALRSVDAPLADFGHNASVLCDTSADDAYRIWRTTTASGHRRSVPPRACVVGLGSGVSPEDLIAQVEVAHYELGRTAVDVMLTDPDIDTVLHVPPEVVRPKIPSRALQRKTAM